LVIESDKGKSNIPWRKKEVRQLKERLEAENVILRKFQLLVPKKICMSSSHKRELENMHAHKNNYQCHTQTIRYGTSTKQNRHIIENS
jgi:hypothetical protein